MRRLIAFITLALTLLAIAIINIPSIQDGMNQGIEFKGGFEILYQVLDQMVKNMHNATKQQLLLLPLKSLRIVWTLLVLKTLKSLLKATT